MSINFANEISSQLHLKLSSFWYYIKQYTFKCYYILKSSNNIMATVPFLFIIAKATLLGRPGQK